MPVATSCRTDEHTDIVAAVQAGNLRQAERLMLHHLDHIQESLKLDAESDEADLEIIFSPGMQRELDT